MRQCSVGHVASGASDRRLALFVYSPHRNCIVTKEGNVYYGGFLSPSVISLFTPHNSRIYSQHCHYMQR